MTRPDQPTPRRLSGSLDRGLSLALLILACGFLSVAASKPLILALGARATGVIEHQEGGVSTRGAYGVRYRFTAGDGRVHGGTAYTASKDARFARVSIAYLRALPQVNMPASGAYALVTGCGWALLGFLSLVASVALRPPKSA